MSNEKIHLRRLLGLTLISAGLLLVGGCAKDEGPTGPRADAAGLRYVGYTSTTSHTPTCVKCHAENGAEWKGTKHADALATLQALPFDTSECLECHTTKWDPTDGLYGSDDAWAAASPDTLLYADVQCERCHGPGSQHNSLTASATDVIGPDEKELWGAELCGECHQDAHHPQYEEWSLSAHARSLEAAGGMVVTNPECAECHVAQSFVEYLETGEGDPVDAAVAQPITCAACHSPHDPENPHQLRTALGDELICGKCHNAEGAMPGDSVHHATWEVFTGTLPFTYPGETYENSTHVTAFGEDKCIGCHVFATPFVDETHPARSGHTFYPKVVACQKCHLGATDFDIYGVQTATKAMMATLQAEIDASGTADQATDGYKDAKYILEVAISDGSYGVHNTKYIQKLLQDAIDKYTPTGS